MEKAQVSVDQKILVAITNKVQNSILKIECKTLTILLVSSRKCFTSQQSLQLCRGENDENPQTNAED